MNDLLDKGIILQSGEINKDNVNLAAGAITQPFVEIVWLKSPYYLLDMSTQFIVFDKINHNANRKVE